MPSDNGASATHDSVYNDRTAEESAGSDINHASAARPELGLLLNRAASDSFGAQRLACACLMRLEEADAVMHDQAFIATLDVAELNLPFLIESLGLLSDNLQSIADAYGHDQVAKRFCWRTD